MKSENIPCRFAASRYKGELLVILVLAWAALSFAADTANKTVKAFDRGDHYVFTMTLAHGATDSTGHLYSQAIDLRGLDVERAVILFKATAGAARDVNLFVQGSDSLKGTYFASAVTRSQWDDYSPDTANLTNIYQAAFAYVSSETFLPATSDTALFKIQDAAFLQKYIRFDQHGQTGNTQHLGNQTEIRLVIPKLPGYDEHPIWRLLTPANRVKSTT